MLIRQAKRIIHKLQLDRAIVVTVLSQMLRVLTGPVSVVALAKCLSDEELGYYYTFQPLLGLSVFLELGFSQNIVQFTAHEASRLTLSKEGALSGDANA
jgi:O-antigen/teichoic acid export membrane protein